LVEGMPCDPERCKYSNGYYDRVHGAVAELLEERAMEPDRVRSVAETHEVCPFELSLDAALWADVLVGDYNYVFDPVVHLQRFAGNPNIALLIDETHQLSGRAREMLSLTLSRNAVRAAMKEGPPGALLRRVRAIDRNLQALKRTESITVEQVIAKPDALLRAIARLVEELAGSEISLDSFPAAWQLAMDCFRWTRADNWYDADRCIHIAQVEGRELTIKRLHLDPGAYLQQVLKGFGGHIRFSGTVSPLPLYQQLHGMHDSPAERAGSPFAAEQLELLVVDDVPTYWRARERSLYRLVDLIAEIVAAQPGNYLVALPSFAYLGSVSEALQVQHPQLAIAAQTPGMSADDRTEFMARFHQANARTVGLVVMGGVFAESVDFSDETSSATGSTIAGVICVGVGLPPPALERKQLEAYYSARGDDGHAVAFQQPAMTKILQMAGRLLRDPADRGVLCLIDGRFKDPAFQRFFPVHWKPRVVAASEVAERLDKFWRGTAGSPRLRAS
ncbi:MAG: hypothetical protein OES38_21555, partial [Gammaproteobacteria bacterium]|nr:hypothetical protein [Gammaproteobacteria bacterium]